MILGLNQYLMISCDKCHSGIDLRSAMKTKGHTDINNIYSCECGNEFSYFDGMINDFCSDHFASEYGFISNIVKHGKAEIIVGETSTVNLGQEIPIINKIMLCPDGGSASVSVEPLVINDRKSFKIVSSERKYNLEFAPESIIKVGERANIGWFIYGRTETLSVDTWRHLLIYAKEQYINKNYLLSFLCSAMSLESFINHVISNDLKNKSIDDSSIEIFLKESTIYDKLFKLLKSLLNISISEKKASRSKLQKLFAKRNLIAHGKVVEVEKEEAQIAFKEVIVSIIDFSKQINDNAA